MSGFINILINGLFGVCIVMAVGYSIYLFLNRKKTENFSVGGGGGSGGGDSGGSGDTKQGSA